MVSFSWIIEDGSCMPNIPTLTALVQALGKELTISFQQT